MKNTAKYFSILFLIPLVCMCGKNEITDPSHDINKPEEAEIVTIKAVVPDSPDTRVSLAQGENKLTLSWSEGDALMVVGNTSEVYEIQEGFDGHEAEFQGKAVEGDNYTVFYPASYATAATLESRSYLGQTQSGNGSLAHLEYNAMANGLTDYSEIDFSADGALCNGVLKLVVKLPDSVTEVSSITLSTEDELFYTTNGTDSKASSLSLGFENCAIGDDHVLTAYIMTSWQDVTIVGNTKLTLDVTVPDKACYYTKTFHHPDDLPLNGGACLNIDISEATVLNHTLAGSGTASDPYQLWDAEDMRLIGSLATADSTYFKMMDDIDMKDVAWTPLSTGMPINFDGNSKTISNFSCTNQSYSSFFGVLNGYAHDIKFDKATVSATGNACGIVAGYVGNAAGSVIGKVKDIAITNSTVSYTAASATTHVGLFAAVGGPGSIIDGVTIDDKSSVTINEKGGFVGSIIGQSRGFLTIRNCVSYASVVNNATSSTALDAGVGGIAGNIGRGNGDIIENCEFHGTISGTDKSYYGGIVGIVWVSSSENTSTVKDCINTANVGASDISYVGGIAGYFQKGEISGCTNSGTITGKLEVGGIAGQVEKSTAISNCYNSGKVSGYGNHTGGISGYQKAGSLSRCGNTGAISTSGANYTGGIVGLFAVGSIDKCYNLGAINGASYIGGIAGLVAAGSSDSRNTVSYCYSTATVTGTTQMIGGLVGDMSSYADMSYCFCTGAVKGARGVGGVIGRAANGSSTATTAANNVIRSCHAYNSSVTATQTAEGYGSGTLVGFASVINTYTDCYRLSDFGNNDASQTKFSCGNEPNELPVDQGNVTPSSPLTLGIVGTSSAKGVLSMKFTYPYHGNVASSDCATMTLLATRLGWDTSIWNIAAGSDYPTLKDNPEK